MKAVVLEEMYCVVCGSLLSFEDQFKLRRSCCSEACWRKTKEHQTALLQAISAARRNEFMASVKTYKEQVRRLFARPVEDPALCLNEAPWRYTTPIH
jgi:predicted aminopeptidase